MTANLSRPVHRVVLALLTITLLFSIVVVEPSVRKQAQAQQASLDTYIIVFDVSGSMRIASQADPSRSRLELAQDAMTSAISALAPNTANIGIRSFSGCGSSRTTLVVPPQPNDPNILNPAIRGLRASGSTGIETALRAAVNDMPTSGSGDNVVLLVSDGGESCGGDPCAAAAEIVASGTQVVVNTVGFQTAGTAAEPQLECIAQATGGTSIAVVEESELFDVVVGTIEQCTEALEVCYAPELRFHPDETHFPTDPTDFVRESELRWAADGGCGESDIANQSEVTANNLNNHFWFEMSGRGAFIFNGCNPTDIGPFQSNQMTAPRKKAADEVTYPRAADGANVLATDEGFYLNWIAGDQNNRPVNQVVSAPTYYFTVTNEAGLTELHYWFFYSFDPKANVLDDFFKHEGDWEHIAVVLDANNQLSQVRYYGHGCDPIVRDRADVQVTQGTHPVVYPAKGSHASYPTPRTSDLTTIPGTQIINWGAVNTWPEDCANGLSGITDDAVFDSTRSGVLQTWDELRFPGVQPWFGFGGLWGNNGLRGDRSGPVGLPYSSEFGAQIIASGGRLTPPPGDLSVPPKDFFQWLEPGRFTFLDGLPGRNFIVVLESLPTVVGSGSYDAAGTANGEYVIPAGTPQGLHRIVIRDASTAEVLGSYPIVVAAPPECLGTSPDIDGDGIIDACDARPDDGPLADFDGDGIANGTDNCPTVSNADQAAEGERSLGNACNSVLGANPNQSFPVVTESVLPDLTPADPTPDPDPDPAPAPAPVPTTPAVVPTATPEPGLVLDPITNLPPEQKGALGFGDPGPIAPAGVVLQPVAPVQPAPVSVPASPPLAIAPAQPPVSTTQQPAGIAVTGVSTSIGAYLGAGLLGFGATMQGLARRRRTR